ncbi:adhesion G-protein coupled receptor G4-like [Archocentrus centrarchus]|uniref:adhesion G-protein coupled receptor G4-like n=1 Tax=Archocentrus centrarchus TaxID=63155 RepID=UPI0011E9CF8B|nr:adhesion G-protein coupled receptor G4-like [Archocentrus centrarchus]
MLTSSSQLNYSLPANLMTVLEFQLLPKAQRYLPKLQSNPPTSVFAYRTASCVFQVHVRMQSDVQDMEEKIRHLLLRPYNNGSISIHLEEEDIEISRILLIKCSAETHHTLKGLFEWTEVSGGKTAVHTCPKNPDHHATRHCKLSLSTHWMAPELEDCAPVVETIPDLQYVEVTADNTLDVVEMIEALLKNHSTLSYQDLATVLDKLEGIISVSVVTPDLGQALLNIISDILKSDSDLVPFTNDISNIIEAVGDRMVGYEGSSTLVAPAVAIAVVDVPGQFNSLTFGVASNRTGKKPEVCKRVTNIFTV